MIQNAYINIRGKPYSSIARENGQDNNNIMTRKVSEWFKVNKILKSSGPYPFNLRLRLMNIRSRYTFY